MNTSIIDSIRFRLFLMLFLSITSIAFIGALGMIGMYYTSSSLEKMYMEQVIPLRNLKTITENYGYKVQNAIIRMNGGEITADEGLDSIRQALVSTQQSWNQFKTYETTGEDLRIIRAIDELMMPADMEIEGVIRLILIFQEQGDRLLSNRLGMIVGSLHPKVSPILDKLDLLSQRAENKAREEYLESSNRNRRNQGLTAGALILFLITGLIIGFKTQATITGQINEIIPVLKRIGGGDLRGVIQVTSGSELGIIARSINEMIISLRKMVAAIGHDSTKLEQMVSQLRENVSLGLKSTQNAVNAAKATAITAKESADKMESLITMSDSLLNEMVGDSRPQIVRVISSQIRDGLIELRNGKLIMIASRCAEIRNDSVMAAREIHHVANRAVELQGVAEHQSNLTRGFHRQHINVKQ